jgi:hypothetical protein
MWLRWVAPGQVMCRITKISVGLGQDKGKISPGWSSGKIQVRVGWS